MNRDTLILLFFGCLFSITTHAVEEDAAIVRKRAVALNQKYHAVFESENKDNARLLVKEYQAFMKDPATVLHQKLRTHCHRNITILVRHFGQEINR